jgi:hypothetical protein
MPLSKYFGGHGEKVMRSMVKQYGKKKALQVFYVTANKRKKKGLLHFVQQNRKAK